MFSGFSEATVAYFLNIRFNNYTGYYQQTKDVYIRDVVSPFSDFIAALAPTMQSIDPLMEVRPNKCLARIYRDTRFSKDKSPLRDHLWLTFRRGGEPRDQSVMYWFELQPESVEWGLGFWGENRPAMDILRRRMIAMPENFERVIDSCHLENNKLMLAGADFKRLVIPETISSTLKPWFIKKQLYIVKQEQSIDKAFSANLVDCVEEDFMAIAPLYHLLRGCVDEFYQTE